MKVLIESTIYDSNEKDLTLVLSYSDIHWLANFLSDTKTKIETGSEISFTIDKNIGKIPSMLL